MPSILIFDCDGVLADTERDGHLRAFNQAFEAHGLTLRWSVEEYARLLAVGGGKERLTSALTPEVLERDGLPTDPAAIRDFVAELHADKTARYTRLVQAGELPARPGVARVAGAAREAGWRLAVASTSAEPSVRAVLDHVAGPDLAPDFAVFAGDVVRRKKPAPDIYLHALASLGAAPDDAVVIEDSRQGTLAALAAELVTVVTVSSLTQAEDFTGAALVVSSLGDAETPMSVISNPNNLDVGEQVDIDLLTQAAQIPRGEPVP